MHQALFYATRKKVIDEKLNYWRAYICIGIITNEMYSMLEDKC